MNRTALLVGLAYTAIGVLSPFLSSPTTVVFWRVAAFVVSGIVFVVHVLHEHFRRRNPARRTAWHAAVGAAVGGLGLALAANIHELGLATGFRPKLLIALVAWPVLTGVPAFVAALAVAAGLVGIEDRRR